MPAILLARRLAKGEVPQRGASPCVDLISLDTYLTALGGWTSALSGTPPMPEVSRRAVSYRDNPAVPAFDDSRALFVFDGVCVLCSGGAGWIMRHDKKARVNFTPAQGTLGQALYVHYGVAMDESYLLIADGRAFTASRGRNRYRWFGKADYCALLTAARSRLV